MKWFRFYHEALHDPKVRRLSDRLYRQWVNILCVASVATPRGVLPELADLADQLRVPPARIASIVEELKAAGLLDETRRGLSPHNWPKRQPKSDDVVTRVSRYRERNRNVTGNNAVTRGSSSLARASRANSSSPSPSVSESVSQKGRGDGGGKPNIFGLYEQLTGQTFSPLLADEMEGIANEHTADCIAYAFREAAANEARTWSYVKAILAGHAAGQCGAARKRPQRRDAKDRQGFARKGARSTGIPITGPDIEAGKRFLAGKV